MTSDKGGYLETLHWSGPSSKLFVLNCSNFLLIDGTRKMNIYHLSLIVTTVVNSLEKYIPIGFLVAPSEHSDSITRQMNLLKLTRTGCCDPSSIQSRSIMTEEGPALVKVASNVDGCHHWLYLFYINQLAIRVSCQHIISFLIKSTFITLQWFYIKYVLFNYIIHFYLFRHLFFYSILVEKCGGTSMALKVDFLMNVSFFNTVRGFSW